MQDSEIFKVNLGKRIAQIRKERGMSQSNLGAALNIDFQSVSRIETGKTNISAYTLSKIAKHLEISLDDLLDFDKLN